MKKILASITFLSLIILLCIVPTFCLPTNMEQAKTQQGMSEKSFSKFLSDFDSGLELYSYKPDEKHEIASMVKIMTANIVLEEIESGKLALDDKVLISKNSQSMGGSQMFLEAESEYSVSDLLKGIIVVSANDASVALAEKISGSHEKFVEKMNNRAKELGMHNTLFCSSTGLPSESAQYSTARDVNIMTRALMKHDLYFKYATIRLEDYHHPDGRVTQMVNTNKLMRTYPYCKGGKTGFTSKAGFCLSALAVKNNLSVVSTAIGCEDSATRFDQVKGMFEYAFAHYSNKVVCAKDEKYVEDIKVRRSPTKSISLAPSQDIKVLYRDDKPLGKIVANIPNVVNAPISKGDIVASVEVQQGDTKHTIPLIAMQNARKSTFLDYIKDLANAW